jgi:hypothetical protein
MKLQYGKSIYGLLILMTCYVNSVGADPLIVQE